MSNSNGKITAPVGVDTDIPQVLGISSTDVETQQMNNAINKWSYYKPVNSPVLGILTMTDDLFRESLKPVYYYAVGEAPASADWKYTKYGGPFRVTDFDGYDHNQYLIAVDVAGIFPSNINFDDCRISCPIKLGPDNLWPKILNLPAGVYYDWALILVCTKGGVRKVYRTGKEGWQTWSVGLFLGDSMNINRSAYDKFKAIGIADYSVDIFTVVIPRNHPDKTDGFIEITSSINYMVLPETILNGKIYNPIKKGVRISNPKPRSFWHVGIKEKGTYRNEYIPEDCLIGGYLIAFKSPTSAEYLWNERGAHIYTYAEWKAATGDYFGGTIAKGQILVGSSGFTHLEGEIYINYYKFPGQDNPTKPIIVQTGTNAQIQWGATQVTVRSENMGVHESNIDNNVFVAFYFVDPNERE